MSRELWRIDFCENGKWEFVEAEESEEEATYTAKALYGPNALEGVARITRYVPEDAVQAERERVIDETVVVLGRRFAQMKGNQPKTEDWDRAIDHVRHETSRLLALIRGDSHD